jgi:hypothetical protein
MLGDAARHAEVWNGMSVATTFEEQLDETRQRVSAMDTRCAAIGRDPATLRRSYYMADSTRPQTGGAVRNYESEDVFVSVARPLAALGISDLVLLYPWTDSDVPMFERIARVFRC